MVKDEIKNVVMKQLELQRLAEYKRVSAELEDVLNELRRLVEDRQSQYFNKELFAAIKELEDLIAERTFYVSYDVINQFWRSIILGTELVSIEELMG